VGDMGDFYNDLKAGSREVKAERLSAADPRGWTQHSPHHWSVKLDGHQLDYWPSTARWRYRGKTHRGNPIGFIDARNPGWRNV
jgi:hypothetical protein